LVFSEKKEKVTKIDRLIKTQQKHKIISINQSSRIIILSISNTVYKLSQSEATYFTLFLIRNRQQDKVEILQVFRNTRIQSKHWNYNSFQRFLWSPNL